MAMIYLVLYMLLPKALSAELLSTSITGHVFGLLYKDIPDLRITVNGGLRSIHIDTRGSYTINDLSVGSYILKFKHPKYDFEDIIIEIDKDLNVKFSFINIYVKNKPIYFNKLYNSPLNYTNLMEEYNMWSLLRKPYFTLSMLFLFISTLPVALNYRNLKNGRIAEVIKRTYDAISHEISKNFKPNKQEHPLSITGTAGDHTGEHGNISAYNIKHPTEPTHGESAGSGAVISPQEGNKKGVEGAKHNKVTARKESKFTSQSVYSCRHGGIRHVENEYDVYYVDNLRRSLLATSKSDVVLKLDGESEDASDFSRPFMNFVKKSALDWGRVELNWRV